MNLVSLLGRTTKDIDLKKTPNGKSTCTFTLAVNRRVKDEADFITCVAWNHTAELLSQYVKKGNRVAITGHIQTRTYEAHGNTVYVTEVVVDDMEFIERKEAQKATQSAPETQDDAFAYDAEYADKLPF